MYFEMSRLRTAFILFALVCVPFSQAATQFAKAGDSGSSVEIFQRVWNRTDLPVDEGVVSRTWMWGSTVSAVISEPYAESPDGTREVQYFDKSRMEITHPDGDPDSVWYVTNGLLVIEMITGRDADRRR